ncbi:MAG: hypothetical protein OXC98_11145 [bacterium]|nr:endonuclease/exonuclease/phosphatase family protein [Acidimicrobiia bacterium]MCY4650905.1 hypothetical protein [bacterium]
MEHQRASWRFLSENRSDADFALLQEACTPPDEVTARIDVGPGPWIHPGWKGAKAVVRLLERFSIHRVPVADIIESAGTHPAIESTARLAVAIVNLWKGERIGLVSVEAAMDSGSAERVPRMIGEIQDHCGADLPWIVGADLTTWWDSDCPVFDEMRRRGLPLMGPYSPTFYSKLHRERPADARLQLDYVFASRSIADRLRVRALNQTDEWGPSDHCRILIDLQPPQTI